MPHSDAGPSQILWGSVGCISLCSLLTVLAMSLPALGLPAIAASLGIANGTSIALVLASQVALAAVLLPLAGIGDWLGYRLVCALGLWVVFIGSIGSVISDSLPALLFCRVLQGIGCAAIFAVCSALIRDSYPLHRLGRGLANNSMMVSVSSALAPSVAGLLLAVGSWQLLFVVPGVLALLALLVGVRALPESVRGAQPPDPAGALLIALTFGSLVFGISLLSLGGSLASGVTVTAAGAILGVFLVQHQRHLASPLLPLDLLRIPAIGLSVATAFASFAAQNVALVALPFILLEALHYGPAQAGLLLSVWPAALLATTAGVGFLVDRTSAERLGTVGLAIASGGFTLAWFGARNPATLATALAVVGIGIGLFHMPNARLIVGSAPLQRRGMVGGLQATTRILGHAVGAAGAAFLLQDAGDLLLPLAVAAAVALGAAVLSALRLRRR
jgi:DHA2 family multidrug resistance protein-like MFS transporter